MSDSTPTLEPCPFCGGEVQPALLHGGGIEWAQVECVEPECGAVGPTPATQDEAIRMWNTRAALDASGNDERLTEAADKQAKLVAALRLARRDDLVSIAMHVADNIEAAIARTQERPRHD